MGKVDIILTSNLNMSIFKKRNILNIYIYNKNYFCLFKFSTSTAVFLKNQSFLRTFSFNISKKEHINENVKFFIKQFSFYEFSKIKFKGKGYKIKKNSNKSLILLFNRAHITTVWWKNVLLKKYKKYKFYIKYSYKNVRFITSIIGVRHINIFTKKGLRQARQIILKKKGKK